MPPCPLLDGPTTADHIEMLRRDGYKDAADHMHLLRSMAVDVAAHNLQLEGQARLLLDLIKHDALPQLLKPQAH